MIKLKVLVGYKDTELGRKVKAGEILEVEEKRGLELLDKAKQNNLLSFAIIRIDKLSGK